MSGMSGLVAVPYVPPPVGRLRSAARLVLCAAVSWYLCLWWGTTTTPVPAALPAVLILREDVYAWPRLGWERLAGVVVGVLLSTVLLHGVPDSAWSFPLVLLCGCAGMYLMGRPGAPNQQVLISALMVYATAVPGYPLARLEESLVGVAVVVLLGPFLWPPDPYRFAAAGMDAYRTGVREQLAGITGGLERGVPVGDPAELPERARLWLLPQASRDAFDRAATGRRLPHRRGGRPPEGLDGRMTLAARTAPALQYFTQELYERARGGSAPPAPGVHGPPDPALCALAPLVRVTADALDAALLGTDFAEHLDRARALDLAHRAAHPGRGDVVLRAGLHLTHEALADLLRGRGAPDRRPRDPGGGPAAGDRPAQPPPV
ncbi:FUSC family protein [Streptomyces sp. NPDC056387]|uniref:FUSC family protein n=1 Tax=Streptomyces sp. NPDC056387 TaxID=3345803 RepID=UPI0035D7B9C2